MASFQGGTTSDKRQATSKRSTRCRVLLLLVTQRGRAAEEPTRLLDLAAVRARSSSRASTRKGL